MIKITNTKLLHIFTLVLFTACSPTRNLVYFSDLKDTGEYKTTIENNVQPKIQPGDLLSIRLSSLNSESNALFNRGVIQSSDNVGANINAENTLDSGYLVDDNGFVNFPVLGKVKIAGLTKEQATDKMTAEIVKFVKAPIVNIRFLNFKVTVIGEVNKPATFTVPTERINILEAVGLAGDLTAYGKRENVLLLREKDGIRSTTRLNLNNKALLSSPYFYLQQNDVVYVEPDRLKEVQASTNPRTLTVIGIAVPIVTAILFNFQNIFTKR